MAVTMPASMAAKKFGCTCQRGNRNQNRHGVCVLCQQEAAEFHRFLIGEQTLQQFLAFMRTR